MQYAIALAAPVEVGMPPPLNILNVFLHCIANVVKKGQISKKLFIQKVLSNHKFLFLGIQIQNFNI